MKSVTSYYVNNFDIFETRDVFGLNLALDNNEILDNSKKKRKVKSYLKRL